MTFNAEWLFRGDDGKSPWTVVEAEEHIRDIAKTVATINPDILGLQEVESCDILNRLIVAIANVNATVSGYKPFLIQGTDTATGQNVGLITRVDPSGDTTRSENRVNWPVPGNKCGYTGSGGTTAVSKHSMTPFVINGKSYTLFNQHFLAYPTQADRCAQREGQASVMRGLINTAINANRSIIVVGDYNDYSDAVPDVANDVPNSRVMSFLRNGLPGDSLKIDPTLVEVSSRIAQANRYTSIYDTDKLSQIDHLLLSNDINIVSASIPHAASGSDHWPFYVDIST